MKQFLRPFFSFNRSERRGMIVLAGILGACILFITFLPLIVPPVSPELQAFAAMPFDSSLQAAPAYAERNMYTQPGKNTPALQPFDPNGLPAEEWVRMGLSPRQAEVLKNYEARTGGFRKAEDLQKCFVISGKFYNRIAPFIRIRKTGAEVSENPSATGSTEIQTDLNTADTTELKRLPGIGSTLALRIVRFRERLGGFHSVAQLRDVYGLKEETYLAIEKRLWTSPVKLRQVSVNYASYEDWLQLPYIDRKTARNIVNYREKNGFFRRLGELGEKGLLNAETYSKCLPYLLL